MPHIYLEYTDNILTTVNTDLFDKISNILINLASIKIEYCKYRYMKIRNYHFGFGNNNQGFIHLEINIIEGRSQYIKDEIKKTLLMLLKKYFTDTNGVDQIQYSVEIREMQRDNYATSNSINTAS